MNPGSPIPHSASGDIFHRSAVAFWEEDISKLRSTLKTFASRNPADLKAYMDEHPEFVREAVRSITVVDVNAAALKLYEAQSKEQLLGPLDKTLDDDALETFKQTIHTIVAGGGEIQRESTARTLGGRQLFIIVNSYIPAEDDPYPNMIVSVIDVSERKQAENALQESEKNLRTSESKYRNLIEFAPEAISVVEDQKIIFCNTRLLEMLGYTNEEVVGIEFRALIHQEDLSRATERYVVRTTGKYLPKTTQRLVKKDGEIIWVDTIGQQIEWEGRPAVLYFSNDITERKRLEEQFAQAQKMEAIGRLAGGVAHDFNNMLQVILGFCSMMKGYTDDKNAILNDLRVIEDAAQRAASLTQQLLAFSRKQVIQPKVIDVGELVKQSEKMLGRVLGEDVALTVVVPEEPSCVRADAGQIQQVIMNLAINARDAIHDGGRIIISIENVALLEAMENEIPGGDYVRITVSDTGLGMDIGTLEHIFEPFFTTKGLGKGTGLGLSIVYGIVKQSGGHIKVESKIGTGSTFTIHLPRIFELTDDNKARAEEESQHGSASILLVEDEAAVRSLVRLILEKHGYTVTDVESGEEAIGVCRAHPEGFDLLITDMVLTGMRGDEVASNVCKIFPRTHVIFMSGYTDKDDATQRENIPILKKPFSAPELLTQVGKILAIKINHPSSSA